MNKCYIVDTFNYNYSHEIFNAGLVTVCSKIFDEIKYISCKSSAECLRKVIVNEKVNNVKYEEIFVWKGKSKYSLLFRYMLSAVNNILFIFKCPKDVVVLFNQNNAFSIMIVNILNKLLNKKIVIICHGELELLDDVVRHRIGFLGLLIKNLVCFFFLKNSIYSDKIKYVVLGDVILSNLKNILAKTIVNNIYSIDHPYVFNNVKVKKIDNSKSINIGTIGEIGKNKNKEIIAFLGKSFKKEISNKELSLSIIGKVHGDKQELIENNIEIFDKKLEREDFNKRIESYDFALFLYDKFNYRYTASGAVFDAINLEKPILSLRNDYFNYLFEKYGVFGILVDSIEGIEKEIRNILNKNIMINYDFKGIKNNLSLDNISLQLKEILIKNKLIN